MPKDADKPNVHFAFSQFDDTETEEFVYLTKDNKRVAFPDIFGMEAEESERMLHSIMSGDVLPLEAVRKWLPADDYELVRKDRLTERQVTQLLEAAQAHYEKSWDIPGNADASANS